MKQVTAFLCAFFFLYTLHAQQIKPSAIPAAVLDQFQFLYPFAKRASWKMNQENFQVDFKNDKRKTTAVFAADGSITQSMTEVNASALPWPALELLKKDDPESPIEEVRIVEDYQGVVTFRVVRDKVNYVFDWTGQQVLPDALVVYEEE